MNARLLYNPRIVSDKDVPPLVSFRSRERILLAGELLE
jgi:hypothetical protein